MRSTNLVLLLLLLLLLLLNCARAPHVDCVVVYRSYSGGGGGVLVKASCSVQRRHESARRRASSLRHHADRCPMMTSSNCQLTWCDKVADSSSYCRASFWTPVDRRRHVTVPAAAKPPQVNHSLPSLFATPTSGEFVTLTTATPAPIYDFLFDVDVTRRRRGHLRSPCWPPSCHVTTVTADRARSSAPSPTEELQALSHQAPAALGCVEGDAADDSRQQAQHNCTTNSD